MPAKGNKISYFLLITQLLGVLAVFYILQLESSHFSKASIVFLLGAMVSWFLPYGMKLNVMTATSLFGLFAFFRFETALAILFISLAIILLCISRLRTLYKIIGIVLFGAALLKWRGSVFQNPVALTVVPVVGTIFMLRVFSYLREVKTNPHLAGWRETLAFFFILPNYVMWFFPLIDYKNFVRGAAAPREIKLYQKGMNWILDGVIQLILYRVLQVAFYHPFEYVHSYGDFFTFLLLNYLNYIRISGSFHIVTGALCLYGIDLPKTHYFYMFSSSCADVGRRLNTYWKDFMVWNVYRPSFDLFHRYGKGVALGISLVAVFGISCLLHEYIYLWSKGTFALRIEDFLFWSGVGIWAGFDIYRERQAKLKNLTVQKGLFYYWSRITLCLFLFSIIWAVWNSHSVKDLIATAWLLKWRGFGDLAWALCFPVIGLLGAWFTLWDEARKENSEEHQSGIHWRTAANFVLLTVVLGLTIPELKNFLPAEKKLFLTNLLDPTYQPEFEAQTRQHSYYDGLKTEEVKDPVDEDELPIDQQPYFESVSDYRRRRLKANTDTTFMGHRFVTNRWGMNDDQDYALTKKPGTLRIALLSASNSMSYGVPNGTQWPKQAEKILKGEGLLNIEILNFSVIGYSALVIPWHFEQEVARFEPDIVIYAGGARELWINGFNASTALRGGLTIPYPDELLPILGLKSADGFLARHYMWGPPYEVSKALYQWGIQKLASQAQSLGAQLIYVMTPMKFVGTSKELEGTYWDEQSMMKVARDSGYFVIDLGRILDADPLQEVTLADDPTNYNHYNVKGHRKVAESFSKQLLDYLKIHFLAKR